MGQLVCWPAAPEQLAQVAELRRSRVRIVYRTVSGRWRQPVVKAAALAAIQATADPPPLPLHNPMGRGIVRRQEKTFASR